MAPFLNVNTNFNAPLFQRECLNMGNIWICCTKRREKKIISLLLIGLDNAGKTVAVSGLAGETLNHVLPTVGVSLINLKYRSFYVKVFDLGGGANIRAIWHRYFVCAHGVIFVVDSSDFARLNEAKTVLGQVLSHEKITGKPLLVLANKQDRGDALDELDLVQGLQLEELVNRCRCPTLVETCAAIEAPHVDPGIRKGYNWLLNHIIRDYGAINARVSDDLKQQEMQDQLEWLQKLERVRSTMDNGVREEDKIETIADNVAMNGNSRDKIARQASVEIDSDDLALIEHETLEGRSARSKSAVQIIKQQLKVAMDERKSSLLPRVRNKTMPANLYGMRMAQSGKMERKSLDLQRRRLRSADDRAITSLDVIAHADDVQQELCDGKQQTSAIKVRPKSSNCSITWSQS